MESVLPICRICLNTSLECIGLQTIFICNAEQKKETNTINYLECLRLCLPNLPIIKDDGPQCICNACDTELQIVYKFIQKAIKSHTIFEENSSTYNLNEFERIEILIENNNEKKNYDLDEFEKVESVIDSSNNHDIHKKKYKDVDSVEENKVELAGDEQQEIFSAKVSEVSHEKNYSADKKFKCNICFRSYTTSHLLQSHLKYHDRKEEKLKSDACEICGKIFSSQRYLRQHMIVHQDIRETLKCQYCNKEYITKTSLNSHERLHQGHTLACSECGKKFTRSYELKIHMRFHKREFPFECTLCGRKFAIKGHLRTHMWQHEGIKLECEECGKLFGSTKALSEHSFTHSVMPYPCEFCHKAYPSKQKYKLHLENVHVTEIKNLGLSNLKSLINVTSSKKRKKYTYVQLVEDEPENN